MDIFVQNVPERINHRELTNFFRKEFHHFGCDILACEKLRNKTCARLTIYDAEAGRLFLAAYGSATFTANASLICHGQALRCRMDKMNQPDSLVLECLAKQFRDRKRKAAAQTGGRIQIAPRQHTFDTTQLDCGIWSYRNNSLIFFSCYRDMRRGHLVLGKKGLVIMQHANSMVIGNVRVNILYHTIDSVAVADGNDATVTFALRQAPIFWRVSGNDDPNNVNSINLANLSLTSSGNQMNPHFEKERICGLHPGHNASVGSCFVYRIQLTNPAQARIVQQSLNAPGAPGSILWRTSSRIYENFEQDMDSLKHVLQRSDRFGNLPFMLQFQVQRLAQNGILSPDIVLKLLPVLQIMMKDFEEFALVEGVRNMARDLPFPGPSAESQVFSQSSILSSIHRYASEFRRSGSTYGLLDRHEHLGLIHCVEVTPTGTYLDGPELVNKNRVLRKYSGFTESFIRVTFSDEDGDRLLTPFGISNEVVYQSRFRKVLTTTIDIAGRSFAFLGFSHSSLRSQTCWFQHPFIYMRSLISARQVIAGLGDFSHIRSPAKCAARIGQAFSDTTESIAIERNAAVRIPDVERNGRCFTDGVGKISEGLLQRVWKEFTRSRKQKATLLQIRYKGAKGMLALDPGLRGEMICLRESMVKFEGSTDETLEICGAAYKALPMYLNRDFVKILEDLGVSPKAFLDLQDRAVSKLEAVIQSYVNAALFLEVNHVSTAAQTPSLIRNMGRLGINFQDDEFLENIIQLAAINKLRDIKYRARIPVDLGYTLHGIVDETGLLRENEVYIAIRDHETNTRRVLEGHMVVTRAPARHPGDVRVARAVNVPRTSPLTKLHNCIVFSQNGDRDLPSQLSGGDLDGDLYQIIYEPSLWPKRVAQPAEYDRVAAVDIGRPVEATDIVDFFVKFMQTDQLGRICNIHTQVADQKSLGVFDPVCLNLAEMASTAVDYSKTGIAVDLTRLPRDRQDYHRLSKPDFMADGPRVTVKERVAFEDEEEDDDETDAVTVLEPDNKPVLYYESKKVLGQLYRAIDERKFLDTMHKRAREQRPDRVLHRVPMNSLWDYVQRTALNIQWTHHRQLAHRIRESYEDALADTIFSYSLHPKYPLSEIEVFCGSILGRNGGFPGRRQREASTEMKEKFDRDAAWTIDWILRGDPDERYYEDDEEEDNLVDVATGGANEALERSIACFSVAMEEEGRHIRGVGTLKSFKYVAASACLQEIIRFKGLYGL